MSEEFPRVVFEFCCPAHECVIRIALSADVEFLMPTKMLADDRCEAVILGAMRLVALSGSVKVVVKGPMDPMIDHDFSSIAMATQRVRYETLRRYMALQRPGLERASFIGHGLGFADPGEEVPSVFDWTEIARRSRTDEHGAVLAGVLRAAFDQGVMAGSRYGPLAVPETRLPKVDFPASDRGSADAAGS